MTLTEAQRREAAGALEVLVGMPLTDMLRYAGWQRFEFGAQRPAKNKKGEEITVAEWGLVLGCYWRIDGPDGFSLSSEHFQPTRRDEHATEFYGRLANAPLVVQFIEVGLDGSLMIVLSDWFSLVAKPSEDVGPDGEAWRFMPPEGDPRGSLVLDSKGLSWSSAS